MALIDWILVGFYLALALMAGLFQARRAGRDIDQFFLAGRRLPWWIAGTSMLAAFSIHTPLVVTGWVRDHGIWKNWIWWSLALGGMLTAFLFARYWRRGRVMTTAELAELRYGGRDAALLRGFLGAAMPLVVGAIPLAWLMLALAVLAEVLLGVPGWQAVAGICVFTAVYGLAAGLWGVVLTDLLQLSLAAVGACALAVLAMDAAGGMEGVRAVVGPGGWSPDVLRFFPAVGEPGAASPLGWTTPFAVFAVYLGVAWWAGYGVDGGPNLVQRIAAARDERQGLFAVLWFHVVQYALRPWPWILVALASLVVLPHLEVASPLGGVVSEVGEAHVAITPDRAAGGASPAAVRFEWDVADPIWHAERRVALNERVEPGAVLAASDSEKAYPAMMLKLLPAGLLGLVVAGLLAVLMAGIDTQINLASSYFVNDLYRRFLRPGQSARHYVGVARLAGLGVLILAGGLALMADSIGGLYVFFLAFLGGVGPVYVLRWLWWRMRASTEIAAMVASLAGAILVTQVEIPWRLGPLTPGGELSDGGRILLVTLFSSTVSLLSLAFSGVPDPRRLVDFYRRVRPLGIWRPVRVHCKEVEPRAEGLPVLVGAAGGALAIFGLLLALGNFFYGRGGLMLICASATVAGAALVCWALSQLELEREDT